MNKKKVLLYIILVISILGILDAGSLTVAKYSGTIAALCGFGPQIDGMNSCLQVQNSEFSYILNTKTASGQDLEVPLSLAGLIFYILTLIYSLILLFKKNVKRREFHIITLLTLTAIGLWMSIVFEAIQAFIIKAFCKYCGVSAILTLILFIAALYLYILTRKEKKEHKDKVKKEKK